MVAATEVVAVETAAVVGVAAADSDSGFPDQKRLPRKPWGVLPSWCSTL